MSLMAVGSGVQVNKSIITVITRFVLWIAVFKKMLNFLYCSVFVVADQCGIWSHLAFLLLGLSCLFICLFVCLFDGTMPTTFVIYCL
jgi:hypothetical protein